MSFIRELHFFINLIVLFLVVLHRVDAECMTDLEKVEKTFYEVYQKEFGSSLSEEIAQLLQEQNELIQLMENDTNLNTDDRPNVEEKTYSILQRIIDTDDEKPWFVLVKVIDNQRKINTHFSVPDTMLDTLEKKIEEKVKEFNLSGRKINSQRAETLSMACNAIRKYCYNDTLWKDFEESTEAYYYRVNPHSSGNVFTRDDVIKFENQPLFPCTSEEIDTFFFTSFSNDSKDLTFIFEKAHSENAVELVAVFEAE